MRLGFPKTLAWSCLVATLLLALAACGVDGSVGAALLDGDQEAAESEQRAASRRCGGRTRDCVAPSLWVTSPAPGASVSGTLTVAGTAADDVALGMVEIAVDAGAFQLASGTTRWSLAIDTRGFPDGVHTAMVRASDKAGNQTTKSVSFTSSNAESPPSTPPPATGLAVAIGAPSGGATVSGMVTVTGTSSGAARVQVRFDALAYLDVPPGPSWSYTFDSALLANGPHTLVARATDASGTATTMQITLTVSNTNAPPEISIMTPAAGATVSGLYQVTGFGFDGNGIGQAQVSVDGGAYQYTSGIGRFTYDLDAAKLSNGMHTLAVRAADDLGATTTTTTTFLVANEEITPPTVAFTSPAPGATVSGPITLRGTASDNDGLARIEVRENYGTFRPATGTYVWSHALDTRGLSNGAHTFYVRAVDFTGNVAATTLTVTVANGSANESLVTPEGVHISVNTASGFSAAEVYRILKENARDLDLIGPALTLVIGDAEWGGTATGGCSSTECSFRIGFSSAPSSSFLRIPAYALAHEYGHVWSWYHVARSSGGSWSDYLAARHLDVDPRVNGTYEMSMMEIAADDYRLEFGSADARQSNGRRLVRYPTMDPALLTWFTTSW